MLTKIVLRSAIRMNIVVQIILVERKPASSEVNMLIRERCGKILEKFGKLAVSGVREPKLIAALEDVKKYWRDFNRPSLTFLSCEAVGGTCEISQDAALMFTLASSGFGIHDDILDRSAKKHLRMTILGLHGIDTALLVGDLLIVKAWTFAHELIRKNSSPTKIADVLEAYGNLSIEICEAEFMETQCRQKVDIDVDYYENVLWKEMAETEACCRIGGMMGDGKPSEIQALSDFGRRLGFISRLKDEVEDCLNIRGDLPHRIKYESVPLPLLYAAKYSFEKQKRIKKIVSKKTLLPSDIKSILNFCFETEAFEYVNNLALKKGEEAHRKLSVLKPSLSQTMLLAIIMQANARVKRLCA
jgi:geranylgeranyl diphosphate synthase type I